jgi:hypothetical protein
MPEGWFAALGVLPGGFFLAPVFHDRQFEEHAVGPHDLKAKGPEQPVHGINRDGRLAGHEPAEDGRRDAREFPQRGLRPTLLFDEENQLFGQRRMSHSVHLRHQRDPRQSRTFFAFLPIQPAELAFDIGS